MSSREPTGDEASEVADLFADLVERPESERASRLEGIEATLRREVEALLRAHAAAGRFLAEPIGFPASARGRGNPGERVGAWRLISEIGRGGMGTVWLAERADGAYEQRAALKRIRGGFVSAVAAERFLRERQLLARLSHPNIARLLDGGLDDGGSPFLVLELVSGAPIDRWCDERRLPVAERLSLFGAVCDAVRHAHSQLVVHRDLKPSNILVDDEGRVKLLDFGVAKLLADEPLAGEAAELTVDAPPFTPEYAAPEQLDGRGATTATDVYSLGVVLAELLTGARPTRAGQGPKVTFAATPISLASAAARGGTPRLLRRALAGDLGAVLERALALAPADRYGSVEAFAEDLDRVVRREPVRARSATLAHRLRLFADRHRLALGSASAALLALLVGLGAALWQARIAELERDRAEAAAREAEAVASYFAELFTNIDPEHEDGAALSATDLLDRGAARLDEALAERPLVRARLQQVLAGVYLHLRNLDPAIRLLEQAIATREAAQGAAHPDLVAPLIDLGATLFRAERSAEARHTIERAREIAEGARLEESPDFARIMLLLGNFALAERSWAAAESAYRRSIELADRTLASPTTQVTAALNNLGVALYGQRRLDEAENVHRRALELRRRSFGEEHFSVAQSCVNLAHVALARKDAATAAPLVERALSIRERTYGHDTTHVAEALSLQAEIAILEGRSLEAEARLRETLRVLARFPSAKGESAAAQARLASVLWHRGDRGAEAEALASAALAVLDGPPVVDPVARARARAVLVEARLRRSDFAGALAVPGGEVAALAPPGGRIAAFGPFLVELRELGLDVEVGRVSDALAGTSTPLP